MSESNYSSALDREATRVVSCNTTSTVRTLTALKRAGSLLRARGTLLRRATDPWESHESRIMNTLVARPARRHESHRSTLATAWSRSNTVKELMADRGRSHDNLYEVALWADMLRVQGDELFYAYMVDNQAIVIPETIDAVRALSGAVKDASESITRTNAALGIETSLM